MLLIKIIQPAAWGLELQMAKWLELIPFRGAQSSALMATLVLCVPPAFQATLDGARTNVGDAQTPLTLSLLP